METEQQTECIYELQEMVNNLNEIRCKTGQDLFKIKKAICRIFDNFECHKFDKELKNIVDEFREA